MTTDSDSIVAASMMGCALDQQCMLDCVDEDRNSFQIPALAGAARPGRAGGKKSGNLAKLASWQGPEAIGFVKEVQGDEDKCYELVQAYLLRCPESVEGSCSGKKRGAWFVVEYMERAKASSSLIKDKAGEPRPMPSLSWQDVSG